MIQLYDKTNTDYSHNGNATLYPISCDLTAELNGSWDLSLEYPTDKHGVYKKIVEGAVLSVPNFVGKNQLYRIYHVTKTDSTVQADARPIFMDAAGEVFLLDTRPTQCTGQMALNKICTSKYKGKSDIIKQQTAYYNCKNLIEAIASDDDNSFLSRWGGEIIYDNYTVIINNSAGSDHEAKALFGYNLAAIEQDVNMDDVVTRIVPKAYNGYMLDGSKPWVDSPNINKYPIVYTKVVEYNDVKLKSDCNEDEESSGFKNLAALRAELKKRAQADFADGLDKPTINYTCDMVALELVDGYKKLKRCITGLSLGDTVTCKNRRLGIETKARVVKITWDCARDCVKSVELGDFKDNYFNSLTSIAKKVDAAINNDGTLKGENIHGIMNSSIAKLRAMRTDAKTAVDKAVLFEDRDPNSATYGAMAIGTSGFMIADELNSDGSDWKWSTFGTGKGFVADYIIAGTMAGVSLILGGLNNKDGTLTVKNASGTVVGTWNKDGLNVKSGTIRGTQITVGGGGKVGLLQSVDGNGKKAIDIDGTQIKFYDYDGNGNLTGELTSITETGNRRRVGVGLMCDSGDYLAIGYKTSGSNSKSLIKIDSAYINAGDKEYNNRPLQLLSIPYIPNTACGDLVIGTTTITLICGIVRKWTQGKTISTKFATGDGSTATVVNGVITDIS